MANVRSEQHDGTYILDVVDLGVHSASAGRSIARCVRDLGIDPGRVLVRVNGELIDDPAAVLPKPGDIVMVDHRVSGA